ncbi:hypothetical protein ACFVMC_13095 [Nocardia sp. NPDC127579]|uniref:hypothetical protein n=1 Tax=Nocardia sp. NPDC127579 TaxID=3345402 RepID=UPI003637DF84
MSGSLGTRLVTLLLALILTLLTGAVATAQPTELTPPDPTSGANPLDPSSDYSVDLNTQIAAFRARVTAWQQRGLDLDARATSLAERIRQHNAQVDSYPNRTAPGPVAASINARAAALNNEKAGLIGEINAWQGEVTALEAERLRLMQLIAHLLQTRYNTVPRLPFRSSPGGDPSRPLTRNKLGQYSRGNGGDASSRAKENAALDAYARNNNVTVIKKQTAARLSPEALAKLSPSDAAKLGSHRFYDGLIRKPNGHYKALEVKSGTAKYQKGQQPFDDAIRAGGYAEAEIDGQRIIIDEVEIVPG